ncbi:hypothetical protein Tco_0347668 [Tanacetum coccineum]
MKRASRGYTGVDIPLFPTMITTPKQAAKIPQSQFPTQTQVADKATFTSVDVDAGGAATTNISLDADRVEVLENDLQQTKKVYSSAFTKLILRVKKLEKKVKTNKARRRARIVISEDEDAKEDSSKQGRKISEIDKDPTISLVQPEQDMEYDFDVSTAEGFTTSSVPITTAKLEISTTNILVSTAGAAVTTASASISTVSPPRVSTAEDISGAETLVYIRMSASKDKGKAIMTEPEPEQTTTKLQQRQERAGFEAAIRLQEQFDEEERQRLARQEEEKYDLEKALELQKQLDEREEVVAKVNQAHDIDWSDPAVLRYQAVQNRSFSIAEVRKNMCIYLKNQGGYKQSHFKGMRYEDMIYLKEYRIKIMLLYLRILRFEKEVMKRSGFDL